MFTSESNDINFDKINPNIYVKMFQNSNKTLRVFYYCLEHNFQFSQSNSLFIDCCRYIMYTPFYLNKSNFKH